MMIVSGSSRTKLLLAASRRRADRATHHRARHRAVDGADVPALPAAPTDPQPYGPHRGNPDRPERIPASPPSRVSNESVTGPNQEIISSQVVAGATVERSPYPRGGEMESR